VMVILILQLLSGSEPHDLSLNGVQTQPRLIRIHVATSATQVVNIHRQWRQRAHATSVVAYIT